MSGFSFIRMWIIDFKVKLCINYLMMRISCNEECTPDSVTKIDCETNIKSVQEDEFLV